MVYKPTLTGHLNAQSIDNLRDVPFLEYQRIQKQFRPVSL